MNLYWETPMIEIRVGRYEKENDQLQKVVGILKNLSD
jgi:hypothetical protein